MAARLCFKVVLLQGFVASVVLQQQQQQQNQFSPEQLGTLQQLIDRLSKVNQTGPLPDDVIRSVAEDVLGNPVISDLIRQSGVADLQSDNGASVLTTAAQTGSLGVVKAALNAGTFIDLQDETGWTPLLHAVSKNHTDVALYLITVGANVNMANNDHGDAPITWSVYNQNLEVTRALLRAGANVNHKDFDGDSPLNMASEPTKSTEIFKLLIQSGANVDDQDNDGWSALILAASHGKLDRVRLLLRANPNPNLKTGYHGDTALHWAIFRGYNEIVRELIVAGADLNTPNNRGVTPLSLAAKNNFPNEARLLLSAGAEIDRQAVDGKTVADIARLRSQYEILNMILAHPTLTCTNDGIVYDLGHTRFDVCREVKCCHGVWSPTGRSLETCGKGCRTLLAPAGVCTGIDNCPSLRSQVQQIIRASPNSYTEGYNFVQQYGCGKDGDTVKVCCPTQV
ncbi:ankyrin repeat domain-containing protein 29-like isoform X2 [Macrobrachium rosenbergii]|uniref:ankyrin repeat domain-containing protein 29-like isoform X2 n=1 Tax=Macrobrachium rosenbergii TaxID=79674 RepID=UPI0034D7ADAA